MDYLILTVIMTAVFAIVSFNGREKSVCAIGSSVAFILLLMYNISFLPVLNLSSFPDVWVEFMVVSFFGFVVYLLPYSESFDKAPKAFVALRTVPFIASILVLFVMWGQCFHFYQADKFCNMLKVDTVSLDQFNHDLFPTSVKKMICIDAEMARKAAEDLLDTDPGLGSRVKVGEMTMQAINGSFTIDGGKKLTFEDGVFDFIVDMAVEYRLGARGLRSIVEAIMMEPMYEIPSQNVDHYEVTIEYAKSQLDKANMNVLKEREN